MAGTGEALFVEMFKQKYGLDVEFKKRIFGRKLQLKKGNNKEVKPGAVGDWLKALALNQKIKDYKDKNVKIKIDFGDDSYDGGVFNPSNNTANIDIGDFNYYNVLDIANTEVKDLHPEAQFQQFSL